MYIKTSLGTCFVDSVQNYPDSTQFGLTLTERWDKVGLAYIAVCEGNLVAVAMTSNRKT